MKSKIFYTLVLLVGAFIALGIGVVITFIPFMYKIYSEKVFTMLVVPVTFIIAYTPILIHDFENKIIQKQTSKYIVFYAVSLMSISGYGIFVTMFFPGFSDNILFLISTSIYILIPAILIKRLRYKIFAK